MRLKRGITTGTMEEPRELKKLMFPSRNTGPF
jgi:hypothetical protein